jgi:hypothetical protein
MVKKAPPIPRRRRSKRKVNFVATRFSKRKQAILQQDHSIYGNDYGILPSGKCADHASFLLSLSNVKNAEISIALRCFPSLR